MSARVEAEAYRVDSLPGPSSGIYAIPSSIADRELGVDRILEEWLRKSVVEVAGTSQAALL